MDYDVLFSYEDDVLEDCRIKLHKRETFLYGYKGQKKRARHPGLQEILDRVNDIFDFRS